MSKAEHLQKKINERSSNPSTAAKYGFREALEIVDSEYQNLKKLPVCKECCGTKKVATLFSQRDCDACFETGIDLSDPLAIVRLQQSLLEKAREIIVSQRKTIYDLAYTEEEKQALSMEQFYKSAKRFD